MKHLQSKVVMLWLAWMVCLLSSSGACAQEIPEPAQLMRDPTVPSEMLKPRAVPQERGPASTPAKLPDWRLKALVVQNRNRGSAILALGDRSIALQLQRQEQSPLCKFTVAGVEYEIIDFDAAGVQVRGPWGSLWIR